MYFTDSIIAIDRFVWGDRFVDFYRSPNNKESLKRLLQTFSGELERTLDNAFFICYDGVDEEELSTRRRGLTPSLALVKQAFLPVLQQIFLLLNGAGELYNSN